MNLQLLYTQEITYNITISRFINIINWLLYIIILKIFVHTIIQQHIIIIHFLSHSKKDKDNFVE